jgi:Zn-dependent protease with chaperone function
MASFLASALSWGPSIYYALSAANNLIGPSRIIAKYNSSLLAKNVYPEVFQKEGKLRDDIAIYKVPNMTNAAALGTSFGPSAILLTSKELASVDQDALDFMSKHEISHIQTNDSFVINVLASVVSAVSNIAIPYIHSWLPWWASPLTYILPTAAGVQTRNVTQNICEDKADRFATRHATPRELKGIERYVQGEIEVNQALHPKYPHLFTKEGNTRMALGDLSHSPLTQRLELIRSELRSRRLPTTQDEGYSESEQMKKIRKYHEKNYRNNFNLGVV